MLGDIHVKSILASDDDELQKEINNLIKTANKPLELVCITFIGHNPNVKRLYQAVFREVLA